MWCVLVLASGAQWEAAALKAISRAPELVLLKRCVDVSDLMGAATTGQADVAVVALESPGLDADAVDHLRRHRVRAIGVDSAPVGRDDEASARRIGVSGHILAADVDQLAGLVTADAETTAVAAVPASATTASASPTNEADQSTTPGRVIVCWGAHGAPGRTTVAVGVAAELARRHQRTMLLDADPWGGSVAQQLGILDEVSGVLAAARLTANGELAERFGTVQRRFEENLTVVTGLPRPDRWPEVRPGSIEHICELGRRSADVVVDTGFGLDEEGLLDVGARPGRNSMTRAALSCADEICVVGSADPVGLARLVRALTELREFTGGQPVRVVVNRMRSTLGWSEREISGMVEGFVSVRGVYFLPEDRTCVDQALMAGGTFTDGALTRALAILVDALFPDRPTAPPSSLFRRRTARTARLR
ncbi:MAG: AAA family ATPase [Nocardioides sp.]